MAIHLDSVMNTTTDGDYSRGNLFLVEIPFLSEKFKLLAKGASIPGISVGETYRSFMGRRIYLAGDVSFEPWTVTVYNDAKFDTWDEIHSWLYQTHATDGNIFGATPAEYKKMGYVHQYRRDTNEPPSKTFGMVNLFPQSISEIRLDWDDNNSVEVFDVTFRFDYFVES